MVGQEIITPMMLNTWSKAKVLNGWHFDWITSLIYQKWCNQITFSLLLYFIFYQQTFCPGQGCGEEIHPKWDASSSVCTQSLTCKKSIPKNQWSLQSDILFWSGCVNTTKALYQNLIIHEVTWSNSSWVRLNAPVIKSETWKRLQGGCNMKMNLLVAIDGIGATGWWQIFPLNT